MAGAAHGVVTRAQLLRPGVSDAEIEQRVKTGALLSEHRGVYRWGTGRPAVRRRQLSAANS